MIESATAASSLLSMSATATLLTTVSACARSIALARVSRHRASNARSGRYVTTLTVREEGSTALELSPVIYQPAAMADIRYSESALTSFAQRLLIAAGLDDAKASDVAQILVTGDLLGHTTHGLALLAPYLGELEKGEMAKTGFPSVITEREATELWDGRRLPGPWLTLRALDAAASMARAHGTGTVVIRRSHHIACLAAYLLQATERGLIVVIKS